jgi:hypothetical protein
MPSKTRSMPGFTAEAAVYASGRSYRVVAGTSASNAASGVFISTQRSSGVRVRMQTRTPFEDWCDHIGGGLSSDPDGGVTCTIYIR